MAQSHSRQLLIWTIPTIAAIFSYFWYRRKRLEPKTDPGDTSEAITTADNSSISTNRTFSRSLSGVDSAPIDIVIPPKLKAVKSNPVVISDEDLDLEIEKIKSMRYSGSMDLRKMNNPTESVAVKPSSIQKSPSPIMAHKIIEEKTLLEPTENSYTAQSFTGSSIQKQSNQRNPPNHSPADVILKLFEPTENSNTTQSSTGNDIQTQGHERDSANPSPADVMLTLFQPTENSNTIQSPTGNDIQRQRNERDSANHSPADVMLASPSLSSISDNQSEGSNDSGKGGSDVVTPPPSRSLGTHSSTSTMVVFEFIIPQSLVGKLIGKHGSSVANIKDKTGAHVVVRKHPTSNKLKVCAIEGSQNEIESALKLVRDKFPLKRFPEVTLEQVTFLPQVSTISLVPDHLYLKLIEGINNDTMVSCIVAPNHLFLQQPTHPSFPNLNILNTFMNVCYSEANSPQLPAPTPENTICAAFTSDSWYRAVILSTDVDSAVCYVKFLDYGGYAYLENSKLRQIRGDFMLLPFQAAECFLANIKPVEESGWRDEAYSAVAEMTKGAIIYTQVIDYTEDGIPLVYCYLILDPSQLVFLNQELVNQGHAEWFGCEAELEGATGVTVT